MKPTHVLAVLALSLISVTTSAVEPNEAKALEARCVQLFSDFAKSTGSKATVEVKYDSLDPVKGHIIKGTVTHDGRQDPVQCAFPAEPASAPKDPPPAK